MFKEKKIKYLKQRLELLEKENAELRSENITLSNQIEANKTTLLSQQEILKDKEIEVELALNEYRELIKQTKKIKEEYKAAIKIANDAKNKFQSDSKKALNQFKKRK